MPNAQRLGLIQKRFWEHAKMPHVAFMTPPVQWPKILSGLGLNRRGKVVKIFSTRNDEVNQKIVDCCFAVL